MAVPVLVLRVGDRTLRVPLPEGWTGQIRLNVFRGQLGRDGHRLERWDPMCLDCGSGRVLVLASTEKLATDPPPARDRP